MHVKTYVKTHVKIYVKAHVKTHVKTYVKTYVKSVPQNGGSAGLLYTLLTSLQYTGSRQEPGDTGCRQEQVYSIQDVNKNKPTVYRGWQGEFWLT